ncbi:MAG: hypothetical protein HC849_00300 [Oscillatoriales cyanobacterium RU_3_3]|nr:hypothetical protein [Microcoleus sp. SU_5_6]NJL70041.1 hypothetical protein [Microcoleus sp. SM1_3_4]NJM58978.1 hypothetical protein [Oscillatoriales cyanobacterium RU_3_3]NJR21510.1 hypothetical protein [Richelia sp. CSU_2_1]
MACVSLEIEIAQFGKPAEHLTDGEIEGFGKGWNGDAIARFFKKCYGAIDRPPNVQRNSGSARAIRLGLRAALTAGTRSP